MKRIPRRLFTEEFKREVIKLVTEQHLNVAAAGRQLDVAPKSIRSWIAESERGELKATLGAAKLTLDQQRIRELAPAVWQVGISLHHSTTGLLYGRLGGHGTQRHDR